VHIVGRDGGEVDLFGWSFPRERVDSSPLAAGAPRARPGVASLGVLHCDMDGGRSPYAPVARGELEATPLDGWLLGHIHKPHTLGGERPIGYLGSLAGLDPGETGAHGPWLVEVEGPGRVRATHRPVSPIRWERVDLTIEALGERDPRDLEDRVHAALDSALAAVHERIAVDLAEPGLRAVGCRVRVSGRGRHHIDVHRLLLDEDKWPVRERDGVHYFVEKVEEALTPDLDLADLARGADPPGLLARHLLEGQRGGPAAVALRARVAARLASELSARPRWRQLDASEPGDAEIDAWIARVGTRLLDALLAQRDARPTTARQQS
jgi:hypothetical protein